MIDGKAFDPNRVDIQVKLGPVEEWIVTNLPLFPGQQTEVHPFHIHINPFQVTAITVDGVTTPVDAKGYDDTIPLPMNGSVTMHMGFRDFVGKFVIHCHILGHEDAGMMAVVEVVP